MQNIALQLQKAKEKMHGLQQGGLGDQKRIISI